jgi:hypothetical protein
MDEFSLNLNKLFATRTLQEDFVGFFMIGNETG